MSDRKMGNPTAKSGELRHIAAIPFPGRGHINPMLALSRRLAAGEILVTVILTDEWLSLLSSASSPPPPFTNLRLSSISNVLPSEKARASDYPSFLHAVLTKMEAPVEALIAGMEPPFDAIVADSLLPWAPEIGRRRGLPVAAFFPQAAVELLALYEFASLHNGGDSPIDLVAGEETDFLDYIPRELPIKSDDSLCNSNFTSNTRSFIKTISWSFTSQTLLLSSFYELEKHAIDTLKTKIQIPIHSIGPLFPNLTQNETNHRQYIDWLDSQSTASVLYIALGSFLSVSKSQIHEILMGIRATGYPFLFVLRGDYEKLDELTVGDKGLVVSWCDQSKVLNHPSIGGFLTHCGWNSVLEAIHSGIPMITFPLAWDQFPNSNLIVNKWRVGFKLKDIKHEGLVTRQEITKVVQKLMDFESVESKEIRRNIRELKEMSRKALGENGSPNLSIGSFIHNVITYKETKKV